MTTRVRRLECASPQGTILVATLLHPQAGMYRAHHVAVRVIPLGERDTVTVISGWQPSINFRTPLMVGKGFVGITGGILCVG
jgi:hypothetical protein